MELKKFKKLRKIIIITLLAAPLFHMFMFAVCTIAGLNILFFTESILLKLCIYFIVFVAAMSALEHIRLVQDNVPCKCMAES